MQRFMKENGHGRYERLPRAAFDWARKPKKLKGRTGESNVGVMRQWLLWLTYTEVAKLPLFLAYEATNQFEGDPPVM